MRSFTLLLSLAAIFIAPYAIAEEREDGNIEMREDMGRQIEQAEMQVRLNHMQLEIHREKAEIEFQQQIRNLELEKKRLEIKRFEQQGRRYHKDGGCIVILLLLCIIVHILAAAWVYTDINNRKSGSGLWIVITLIAGLMGALVYAVVRLGDMSSAGTKTK